MISFSDETLGNTVSKEIVVFQIPSLLSEKWYKDPYKSNMNISIFLILHLFLGNPKKGFQKSFLCRARFYSDKKRVLPLPFLSFKNFCQQKYDLHSMYCNSQGKVSNIVDARKEERRPKTLD